MESAPETDDVGDFEARRASEVVRDEQVDASEPESLELEDSAAELVDHESERLSDTQEWVEIVRRESALIEILDESEGEIDPQGNAHFVTKVSKI